jgi:hypothetical protein
MAEEERGESACNRNEENQLAIGTGKISLQAQRVTTIVVKEAQ